MNYSRIMNICKKRKWMTIYTDRDRQWVSDGGAVYPLLGMPKLNEQSIRAIYDIPDNVQILEEEGLPKGYSFEDIDMAENPVFMEKIQLQPSGLDTVSFRTQAGVTFIKEQYLSPITGVQSDGNVGIYERVSTETGQVYIAVKRGMMLEAVILPVRVLAKDWLEDLKELCSMMIATYNREAE